MATKATKSDFRSILTDIKKKEFSPVYLLMGEEAYYIDKLVEALEENVVAEEDKDFNFTTYYAQDTDMATVIAACQQYPFMADRKIVLLKETQSMDRAANKLAELAEYVARPNEANILVISHKGESLAATSPLVKAATKSDAVVFRSPKLRDYEVVGPIKDYCRAKKIGIEEKALKMLVEYLGTSLSKIFGEIDKLIVGAVDLDRITPELVERNIGISKDYNNFELQSAIATKDYDKCLRIVKYFESNPRKNPTVVTTGTLFGFFSKLVCGIFSSDKSDQGLMIAMGLKSPYALKEYKEAMMKYTPMQAVKAIRLLRDFDTRSKGVDSFQNEYVLLRELIYNLFTVR